ncbi:MAG: restriction endonuclease [Candidatus Goldbacteria bacterium]|nr:restriction endonuclease [Candidatus Goldiibacteriota bacterium]HPD18409.1 restriction endonuclease [Candidatus Goldiibacteriota bacterium]
MDYKKFKKIFNFEIFEESKAELIEKIAKNPERYIGLFRPTKPRAKILQNLLQSHEIRFGDAFEILIEEYLKIFDFKILNKNYATEDGEKLDIDQCFEKRGQIYFIEQKIRDDHDSTKKRGQIQNFEKKLNEMIKQHGEKKLIGIFYFIDPDLVKNKKYYNTELKRMAEAYGVRLYLFYGEELFVFLKHKEIWKEIIIYLKKWKKEIPELPQTNFDINPETSFEEIRDLNPTWFRSIFENDEIFNNIIITIFPQRKTLVLLKKYFKSKQSEQTIYKTLTKLLESRC